MRKKQFRIGVVVIGRDEGERLRGSLQSIRLETNMIVYVDSGSSDSSISIAIACGAHVIELDMTSPFNAARARNAGYEELIRLNSDVEFVQFVDGDCELVSGWMDKAVSVFMQRDEVAIVAGRLNEKNPLDSVYNRLGELEWNFHGTGEVTAVGGIFMVRRTAFDIVGGFDPSVFAGEEPELCQRLGKNNWKIIRLVFNMATHDLAMTQFYQWWKRQIRGGYGGLDVALRFNLKGFVRNSLRARLWTLWLLVSLFLVCFLLVTPFSLLPTFISVMVIGLWPLQLMRIALKTWKKGVSVGISVFYAWFTMVSFWPQFIGQVQYKIDKMRNRSLRLIEYKK